MVILSKESHKEGVGEVMAREVLVLSVKFLGT